MIFKTHVVRFRMVAYELRQKRGGAVAGYTPTLYAVRDSSRLKRNILYLGHITTKKLKP